MYPITKTFYEKKEQNEVWNIIKGRSYFGWTEYPDMLDILKEHLRTRNMTGPAVVNFNAEIKLYTKRLNTTIAFVLENTS